MQAFQLSPALAAWSRGVISEAGFLFDSSVSRTFLPLCSFLLCPRALSWNPEICSSWQLLFGVKVRLELKTDAPSGEFSSPAQTLVHRVSVSPSACWNPQSPISPSLPHSSLFSPPFPLWFSEADFLEIVGSFPFYQALNQPLNVLVSQY